jgi:hypothetical protein
MLRRRIASLGALFVLLVALLACSGSEPDPIVPQVWSKHGPDGASYEYKVNDFADHDRVEDGFLYGLDGVDVIEPGGRVVPLAIDLPGPVGDGAVNPRWVVYGPPGDGFPVSGRYVFVFRRGGGEARRMHVDYVARHIGYPTDVEAGLDGDVLRVTWTPPIVGPVHTYKVLVWAGASLRISEVVAGGASSSLEVAGAAAALGPGGAFRVSVAAFGPESFSYGEDVWIDLNPPK